MSVGPLNLYEGVRKLGLKPRILNVSSHVYGSLPSSKTDFAEDSELKPNSPYTASKIMGEFLARNYFLSFALEILTVRPFTHIGPRQPATFSCSDFAQQIALVRKGTTPPILRTGNLEAERDFTDVRDVVRAYWLVATKGKAGEVYN